MNKKYRWQINRQIRAPKVRVIGPDDKQIGVLSINEALDKAKEEELDLVEIAPKANPPVCKIVDFGKFRYQEERKERKLKKKTKSAELKEVRFSPFIAEHDFETRFERINEFLGEKSKVKVVVVFKGRHMGSKEFGYKLFGRITEKLQGRISIDMEPKFLGRHLAMIISPTSKIVKTEKNGTKEQK